MMADLYINNYTGQTAETRIAPNFNGQNGQKLDRKELISAIKNSYQLIMPYLHKGESIEGLLNDK